MPPYGAILPRTEEQRRAINKIFTLMSLLINHPDYKTIKPILLDLNKYIMSKENTNEK